MNKLKKYLNRTELNISTTFNQLTSKNKIVFYFFRVITFTAEWWMYIIYALLLLLINEKIAIPSIKVGLIAYSLHYPIYYIIKNTFKRKRPFERYDTIEGLVKPPDKYSLPSGHASASTITTLIVISFWPELNLIIVWPLLVAISRIMLGVHYISDAIMGFLLGLVCYYLSKWIWLII